MDAAGLCAGVHAFSVLRARGVVLDVDKQPKNNTVNRELQRGRSQGRMVLRWQPLVGRRQADEPAPTADGEVRSLGVALCPSVYQNGNGTAGRGVNLGGGSHAKTLRRKGSATQCPSRASRLRVRLLPVSGVTRRRRGMQAVPLIRVHPWANGNGTARCGVTQGGVAAKTPQMDADKS